MSRRTLSITVAALAATVALVPGVANAAGSAHGSASSNGSATGGRSFGVTAVPKISPASDAHFSSPASKAFRVQAPALSTVKSAATFRAATAKTAATGTTYYANTYPFACSGSTDTGDGSQANPFCLVQDAVDAAAPGDTIDVLGTSGYSSQAPVTVRTSDLTIVGIGSSAWIDTNSTTPALTLDGVTGVTVTNLMLTASGAPAVNIVGSSGVTLDASLVSESLGTHQAVNTLAVDGTSHDVTVSRTYLDTGGWWDGANAVSVAAGASNVTLASNVLAGAGIAATGVSGLDVTGNTIQRGCSTGIDIEGTSTGVSLQNNLLEDANPTTDSMTGGFASTCTTNSQTWAPDITVSADASTGTTADYNDFYVYGTDATAPYSWAGTTYPTLAGFRTGATQGSHDTNDSVQATPITLRWNQSTQADVDLHTGSAAIGSANPSAPGALATDFYGSGGYTSRGAVQFLSLNPNLGMSLDGEPTSAYGVALTADVKSNYTALNLSVSWGDGTSTQTSFTGGQNVPVTHEYTKIGTYAVTFTVSDGTGDAVSNVLNLWTLGSDYTAYGPKRLLDTRDGTGAAKAKVKAHATVHLKVAGTGTVPATATAAVLNLTVTRPTTAGYITAYAYGDTKPTTSNVNFTTGQTVPNQVIVPIGTNGDVSLYNGSGGTVDLIADIAGYYTHTAASGYTALSPYRIVDTRSGTGAPKKQLAANASFAAQIAGNDGKKLPASGITAVALNVTVTGSLSSGFLTVYPDGKSLPVASNLNFSKGQTIANSVIAPVGTDGKIRVYNGSTKATSVVVDVVGYYSAASKSAYVPFSPTRFLDTRDKKEWSGGPLVNDSYAWIAVADGSPDVTAFVFNTTVTSTTGTGYLTVSPDPNTLDAYNGDWATWPKKPNVSTLNWTHGKTVPNLVQSSTGSTGLVDFWDSGNGTTNLVVDGFGYYQND